jgi:hypothetical protein
MPRILLLVRKIEYTKLGVQGEERRGEERRKSD